MNIEELKLVGDDQTRKLGEAIIKAFGIPRSQNKANRFETAEFGDKTELGIGAVVLHLVWEALK